METGVITMTFNDKVSNEVIQNIINKFYKDNENSISGMSFWQFKDESSLKHIKNKISEYEEGLKKKV